MRWRSLRTRLTASSAMVIFLAAAIAGAGTAWQTWREGVRSLDESLARQARAMANLLRKSGPAGPAKLRSALNSMPDPRHGLVRVWNADGTLLLNYVHLRTSTVPMESLPAPGKTRFETVRLGGERIRRGYFSINGYCVEIGGDISDIEDTVQDLIPIYLIVLPLLLGLIIGGGFWLAGRALRPIQDLAQEAETITAEHLDRRLPLGAADDEIRRLAKVLNAMLERFQLSFDQTRHFSTDASHELRTPLTILRAHLESAAYVELDPVALQKTLSLALEEVDRLIRIINGLLLFSRSDTDQLHLERKPLDFSVFAHGLVDDLELLASGNELQVLANITPDLWIEGDEAYLRQILLNLFDNSCKYNFYRGSVRLLVERRGKNALLTIANTGPPISQPQARHLFDRFYRGDPTRGREVDGVGLGLPIAREIAKAHFASLSFVSSEGGWTTFALSLPCFEAVRAPAEATA